MKSMTERDKLILSVVVIIMFALGIYKFCWGSMGQEWQKVQEKKMTVQVETKDGASIKNEYNNLTAEKQELQEKIKKTGESYKGVGMDKETFLVFFNNITKSNNVRVLSYIYQGGNTSDNIEKTSYAVEVKGSMENLNNMVRAFNVSGVKFSVGNLSIRADGTYNFLKRNFDGASDFRWYSTNTKQEDVPESIISGDCRLFFTFNLLSYMEG